MTLKLILNIYNDIDIINFNEHLFFSWLVCNDFIVEELRITDFEILKKMSSLQLIIQHKKYGTKLTQNVNDEMFCAGLEEGGKGVCTVR